MSLEREDPSYTLLLIDLLENSTPGCSEGCIKLKLLADTVAYNGLKQVGNVEVNTDGFSDYTTQCQLGPETEGSCGSMKKVCRHPELADLSYEAIHLKAEEFFLPEQKL